MGCDGWIVDPEQPFSIDLRCYSCSRPINWERPAEGHEDCRWPDGSLPASLEENNWLDR